MADDELLAEDAAVLKYLRAQVDRLQDDRWRQGAPAGIENELKVAMRDLTRFTAGIRQRGYNI